MAPLGVCKGEIARWPLRCRERDIVDTIFHASSQTGQKSAQERTLPNSRGSWAQYLRVMVVGSPRALVWLVLAYGWAVGLHR